MENYVKKSELIYLIKLFKYERICNFMKNINIIFHFYLSWAICSSFEPSDDTSTRISSMFFTYKYFFNINLLYTNVPNIMKQKPVAFTRFTAMSVDYNL
jgi:hypothetical protein